MSVRISTSLDLIAGADGALDQKIFGGSGVLSTLLDTLEHAMSSTYVIDAQATETIDFGDISETRIVYIEGDGEFSIAFSAAAATAASRVGAGGTYPTAFAGGESLELEIDGSPITVTFEAVDQTRDQVVARINYAAALAGFLATPVAFPSTTELRLDSPTVGPASSVEVLATSDAAVLTALGLTAGLTEGDAAEPGTTDVAVERPADPSGASAAAGVPSWFYGSVKATALQVTNTQAAATLRLKVFIAGDLVATP